MDASGWSPGAQPDVHQAIDSMPTAGTDAWSGGTGRSAAPLELK
jgi:hypothetical protein